MAGQKPAKPPSLRLGNIDFAKRVVSILRRPIPRFFRRSGASLCGSFPEHPSAPAVVTHPHGPTARIIPFPAPQEPISAARHPSPSITRILTYTGPHTSPAARSALPLLFPNSLR
jgi:hypothetical protein